MLYEYKRSTKQKKKQYTNQEAKEKPKRNKMLSQK